VTKAKALTCVNCRSSQDYLGLKNLGYSPTEVGRLTDDSKPAYK
jgi:hypothetical protein